MVSILIADDDAVDREAAERCLTTLRDANIRHAANGLEALACIREAPPDVVLTDLRMPEMDGLTLVEHLRTEYPLIPVILMTSMGSERIAVQALQAGASSYVPKRDLETDLLEEVEKALEIAKAIRSQREVLKHLGRCEMHFELATDPDLAYPLAGFVENNLERIGFGTPAERTHIGVALTEAVANAMIHGNLEVGSKIRRASQSAYRGLIRERRNTAPYKNRKVRFTALESSEEVEYTLEDEGPGFDPATLPDPTAPENLTSASGRGLLLIRTFMDAVAFNPKGNVITMRKRTALQATDQMVEAAG